MREIEVEQKDKLNHALVSEKILEDYLSGNPTEDEIAEIGLSGISEFIKPRFLWGVKRCIKGLKEEMAWRRNPSDI